LQGTNSHEARLSILNNAVNQKRQKALTDFFKPRPETKKRGRDDEDPDSKSNPAKKPRAEKK
jgi:hypothetical protein